MVVSPPLTVSLPKARGSVLINFTAHLSPKPFAVSPSFLKQTHPHLAPNAIDSVYSNINYKNQSSPKNNWHFSNMRLLLCTTTTVTTTMPSAASSSSSSPFSSTSKPKSNHAHNSNSNSHSLLCKHSPSATLDLLILILVLFSGAFLLSSYFSYIFNSLSLLLAQSTPQLHQFPISYILGFFVFFVVSVLVIEFCCGARSRKCDKPGCKGIKKAMEFDLQLQTGDCIKTASNEIDKLPWKGGTEGNPDYECLRSELRKMAPPNGRAVLLFRARCGCPIAKLEGWGPRKGKRHKKSLTLAGLNGGDHR